MQPPIALEAAVLARLFSDNYRFTLPWYQRAYAWSDEHASRLLEDIREASTQRQWYHLGTIILAESEDAAGFSIVDGQQRVTTLTILFAVLRDLIDDAGGRRSLDERIWSSSGDEKTPVARLSPRDSITQILRDHVQTDQATLREPSETIADEFNVSQSKVIENRDALRRALKPLKQAELRQIADHLQTRCYVVVEKFSDKETAARVFTNAQERGLRLVPTDLFKVSVLNHVPAASRDECAEVWDKCAARLGNENLTKLLAHMRDIKVRKKMKAPVGKELFQQYGIEENAKAFVMEEFAPMAELFAKVRNFSLGGGAFDAKD